MIYSYNHKLKECLINDLLDFNSKVKYINPEYVPKLNVVWKLRYHSNIFVINSKTKTQLYLDEILIQLSKCCYSSDFAST